MRPTRLSRSPPHVCAATSGACIASYTPWIVRRAAGGHVTSNALHSAVMVSPPPLRASLALAQRAFALLSPGRGALRQPRRSPAANSPMVHSDAPRMPATRLLPLWRARRATPRGFLRSPLANGARPRRARGSRDERTVNFSNFFSQLLHRHALQVSIDKERAPPPRLLKRKPITAIREAAAPASASPARYNPGHPSLRPETALNYARCFLTCALCGICDGIPSPRVDTGA